MEDEKHFLLICPKYQASREKFSQAILDFSGGKWDLKHRSEEDTFLLLMQGTGDENEATIFRLFHGHLKRCFNLRNSEEE